MALSVDDLINRLNLDTAYLLSGNCVNYSPVDGKMIASFPLFDEQTIKAVIKRAKKAFSYWQESSAHQRCVLMTLLGREIQKNQEDLAQLIVLESGKLYSQAIAEVQKSVEICEYVAGFGARISGISVPTDGATLSVSETLFPVGVVSVITGFNFPLRDFIFHATLALACGNTVIWRPSRFSTLIAFAVTTLLKKVIAQSTEFFPENLCQNIVCSREDTVFLTDSPDVAMVCAVGSSSMIHFVVGRVAARLGRTLVSLGGNNIAVVGQSADIDLAVNHIMQGTIVDCGQGCTSLQRLFCHRSVYDQVVAKLKKGLDQVYVDSPFEQRSQIGPLIDKQAFDRMRFALDQSRRDGGVVFGGKRIMVGDYENAYYVTPSLVEMPTQTLTVRTLLKAPVLFVMPFDDLSEVIESSTGVDKTLISCLFTNDVKEMGLFTSALGIESRVVSVNTGSTGVDFRTISGAENVSFEETWRAYMQSKTCIINYNF